MSDSDPVDPETRLENAPVPERELWEILRTVEDPELPVSVVDLGLIYDVEIEDSVVTVTMTLTYSGCPARDLLVDDISNTLSKSDAVDAVDVSIVYSPQWSPERITTRGKRDLTEFGLAVPETNPTEKCQ